MVEEGRDLLEILSHHSSMASARLFLVLFLLSFAAAASSRKVSLALYYETLCPYCSNFIVNHLTKIFHDGLIDIVDLDLIPYGNAKLSSNGTITCQHGSYECLLNTVESCALHAWPDLNQHFSFIYCVEKLVVDHKYLEWESCFSKSGLNSADVMKCYDSGYGYKLELEYAAKTDSLKPPHTYVPWVVVNGQPLYEDYENFESFICQAYDGEPPKVCSGLSDAIKQAAKGSSHVSYSEEIINSSENKMTDEMKIKMVV